MKLSVSKNSRELIVLLIVIITLCFSIVYTNVQTYDPAVTPRSGYLDTVNYIKAAKGDFSGIGTTRNYTTFRLLVPFLASLVPDFPKFLFHPTNRLLSPDVKIAINFGVINLFLLIGAAVSLYFLQRGFDFNYFQAFLGVILFLSSTAVVRGIGLPMMNAALFFFFTLSLSAIQRNNWRLLLLTFTIGIIAHELILLLVPMIILSLLPWRRKLVFLTCLIPGFILYLGIMFFMLGKYQGYQFGQTAAFFGKEIHRLSHPLFSASIYIRKIMNLFFTFGLNWPPFIYALMYCKIPLLLKRWSWFVLIIFAGVVITSANIMLSFFITFPVVIPLAVIGLSSWLNELSE